MYHVYEQLVHGRYMMMGRPGRNRTLDLSIASPMLDLTITLYSVQQIHNGY